MKESTKEIIFYYKSYLNKKKKDNNININNTSYEEIKKLKLKAEKELNSLEKLSEKYKLYDENYNKFMIAMGYLAISIENIENNNDFAEEIENDFETLHNNFEYLEQINIMKDVYIWKFVNQKEKNND